MYGRPLYGKKPKRENFPKFIETTDGQIFYIEKMIDQFLLLGGKEARYYHYEDEQFYDKNKNILQLIPLSPRLYKPRSWSWKLK